MSHTALTLCVFDWGGELKRGVMTQNNKTHVASHWKYFKY